MTKQSVITEVRIEGTSVEYDVAREEFIDNRWKATGRIRNNPVDPHSINKMIEILNNTTKLTCRIIDYGYLNPEWFVMRNACLNELAKAETKGYKIKYIKELEN